MHRNIDIIFRGLSELHREERCSFVCVAYRIVISV